MLTATTLNATSLACRQSRTCLGLQSLHYVPRYQCLLILFESIGLRAFPGSGSPSRRPHGPQSRPDSWQMVLGAELKRIQLTSSDSKLALICGTHHERRRCIRLPTQHGVPFMSQVHSSTANACWHLTDVLLRGNLPAINNSIPVAITYHVASRKRIFNTKCAPWLQRQHVVKSCNWIGGPERWQSLRLVS